MLKLNPCKKDMRAEIKLQTYPWRSKLNYIKVGVPKFDSYLTIESNFISKSDRSVTHLTGIYHWNSTGFH